MSGSERRTLAKIFSRELVRELRALFLSASSLERLPVPAASAADAFCEMRRQNNRGLAGGGGREGVKQTQDAGNG